MSKFTGGLRKGKGSQYERGSRGSDAHNRRVVEGQYISKSMYIIALLYFIVTRNHSKIALESRPTAAEQAPRHFDTIYDDLPLTWIAFAPLLPRLAYKRTNTAGRVTETNFDVMNYSISVMR
ncbi:hypothetical protein ACJJTC_006632 [Scirpophaga incertulas]